MMAKRAKDRLPHILQTFHTRLKQAPDNKAYKKQLAHDLSILCSKNPDTVSAVIYETLFEFFRSKSEELYADKEIRGELGNVNLLWWESNGGHRSVNANYYLEHWQANYAGLAENWGQIRKDPDKLNRIMVRIKKGIAGLLFVVEYEDVVYATLEYHQETYRRLKAASHAGEPPVEYPDEYNGLVRELAGYASAFPYGQGIQFLGELSGAYILACPAQHILPGTLFQDIAQQFARYSTEEKCAMALIKYICGYGSQEFAISASELPLSYIRLPDERWKFLVKIPDAFF